MQTISTPLPEAQRVRGTLDLLPEDAARLRNLGNRLRHFFELYAYQGIDTPVLETLDLFLRKSGDEIAARMYTFTHWNRKLCLRPEFTASVMRAYVNGMQERALPLRLQYAGPTFRYEKPQRGRYRQFTQVGLECIGASGAVADAEVLQLACGALEAVGLPRYRLVVGHLGVVLQLLAQLGLSPHAQTLVLSTLEHLARRGADPAAASERIVSLLGSSAERTNGSFEQDELEPPLLPDLVARFGPSGATRVAADLLALGGLPLEGGSRSTEDIVQRLLEKAARIDPARAIRSAIDFIGRLHSLAGPLDTALPELLQLLEEYHLDTGPLEEVRAALDLFACYGSRPADVTIDLSLGRGLRYYTGLVFEIYYDGADGALQLCGGGRYDDLVRALGGRSAVPACGFSFGLERVDLCLSDVETQEPAAADLLLAVLDESAAPDAVRAAEAARATGVRVELDLRPSAARGALRRALRARIPLVAMLGSREREDGQIVLRQLKERTEQRVSLADFVAAVRQAL